MSMEEAVENSVFIREALEEILCLKKRSLPLKVITDNKSLLEAVYGNKPISNKRLRKYVEVIKQALKDSDVSEIVWTPSQEMIADVLTKKGVNPISLMRILQTGDRRITERN